MERCCQQLLILSQVHPHAVVFCFPLLMLSLFFFIFTLPPQYLLYLHLCFTPSLSCCLSVMWSRTDAGSPNCGTAISALLWLLGSPSETGFGDAPPSPSASKKREREKERERERGRVAELAIRPSAKIQMIPPKCLCFQNGPLHICSAAEHIVSLGASGEYGFVTKTQLLAHRTARHISTVMLPTFWCVCDGNCCVQILCHHA